MTLFGRINRRISSSFSSSLLFFGMAAMVVAISAAGALSSAFRRVQIKANIEDLHRSLIEQLALSIGPAAWDLDGDVIEATLDAAILIDSVIGIEIADFGTKTTYSRWKGEDGAILAGGNGGLAVLAGRADLDQTVDIVFGGRLIGALRLVGSYAPGLAGFRSTFPVFFLSQLLLLTVVFSVLYLVSRRAARSVSDLDRTVMAFAGGDKDARIRIKGNDEFSRLATRFNSMADVIREYTDNMEALVKERSDQLIESEKLAALGSLVASVAHEINTPVGISLTAASLIEEKNAELLVRREENTMSFADLVDFQETVKESSSVLLSSLRRTADLIASFKNVSADQMVETSRTVKLCPQLNDIAVSLRPVLRKRDCTLDVECPGDLEIVVNSGTLFQIVANLVLNASIHAYPKGGGGISLRAEAGGTPGGIVITVTDRGRGIPADIRGRIFQPFFTTNRGKGGTGLGLTIVHNTLMRIGGSIAVETAPGEGATFTVTLPPACAGKEG